MSIPCPSVLPVVLLAVGSGLLGCNEGRHWKQVPVSWAVSTPECEPTSLSGSVFQPDGSPVPGVEVAVAANKSALTDARGNFIILDPPSGKILLEVDGTTAKVMGASFPVVTVLVEVATSGPTGIPGGVTLPNFNDPTVANATVDLDSGSVTLETNASSEDLSTGLSIPRGTFVQVDGRTTTGQLKVSLLSVPASQTPMPLSIAGRELDSTGMVTIEPADISFWPALVLVLPNGRGFPIGTMVDIWSFFDYGLDHPQDQDHGRWVNLSTLKGRQGTVVDLGNGTTAIRAEAVVTKGGLHAAALPVDPACATLFVGRVVDPDARGIPGVGVALGTGNFATTDSHGFFKVFAVPAYDAGALLRGEQCTAIDTMLTLLAPVSFGAVRTTRQVPAAEVVPAGVTQVGDILMEPADTGDLAGTVTLDGEAIAGIVTIRGPSQTTTESHQSGAFFVAGLEPGKYTASFKFPTSVAPDQVAFEVERHELTSIAIARTIAPASANEVTVLVVCGDDGSGSGRPVKGASVLLQGSDPRSAVGLIGTSNAEGKVTFHADPPFTLTAQLDQVEPDRSGPEPTDRFLRSRRATTLVDIQPASGTIGIPICGVGSSRPIREDATLTGTVSNIDALGGTADGLSIWVASPDDDRVSKTASVDPATGHYSTAIPSGMVLDVVLIQLGSNSQRNAIVRGGIGPARRGKSIILDFDGTSGDVLAFDRTIHLTYENRRAASDSARVLLRIERGATEFEFPVNNGFSLPDSVAIPDLAHPGLAGFTAFLELNVWDTSWPQTENPRRCRRLLSSTPKNLTFTLPVQPTITAPFPGRHLSLSEAQKLKVRINAGTSGPSSGINYVFLDGFLRSPLEGPIDSVFWRVLLPANQTSVTLPPTALPMFTENLYFLDVLQFRIDEPVNYAALFSANVAQNLRGVFRAAEQCSSWDSSGLSVRCRGSDGR